MSIEKVFGQGFCRGVGGRGDLSVHHAVRLTADKMHGTQSKTASLTMALG